MKTIEISGKTYELKFGFNALADMEQALGKPIDKIGEIGGLTLVRTMFLFGLKHQHPKLSERKAGDLLDEFMSEGGKIEDLSVAIKVAMEGFTGGAAMPSDE
ncbi:hypothetical protein [Sporosarcina beigongshangi]|uniref:hypothetical protein n=1 Tax=Sporosarcina beigongshangi TaxID=2782538 RepID=UPI00193A5143|nr:hypothetical protein [Sporosarcina beigongshangi]